MFDTFCFIYGKRVWLLIWTNVNPLNPRMLRCIMVGWKWAWGSWKVENVKKKITDRRTSDRMWSKSSLKLLAQISLKLNHFWLIKTLLSKIYTIKYHCSFLLRYVCHDCSRKDSGCSTVEGSYFAWRCDIAIRWHFWWNSMQMFFNYFITAFICNAKTKIHTYRMSFM